ncbi:hypothetical protein Q1695_015735 [Nippostrongylus brasiliensis]|nr:hypothetical protein Q1695_015735 [Nippostrongylus brasiliensis]
MLRALSGTHRLLQSVWKRTLAAVPPTEGVSADPVEEKDVADPIETGATSVAPVVTEKYSADAITKLKLNEYPFYVEREWWKKGKRMTFWATWRQLRDVKRREHIQEFGADRMRFRALKWNTVLPQAIRDDAAAALENMPKYAIPRRVLNMCMFTARQRGKIKPYRLNRHLFRKLADHSKLSGVQRAMW